MRRYPLYIFDLDGTLFRGNQPIPDAVEAVRHLRSEGAQIRYLTNNSSTTRAVYKDKLESMGYEAHEQEIYSSATGSASRLQELHIQTVFVLGEPGLVETLEQSDLEVVPPNQHPEALLVGICRTLTYDLLNDAMQVGLSGARFFATNTDSTYPLEGGAEVPGAGSIVAAVRTCLGREPEVFGKPNPYLIDLILQEASLKPADALVIGDRYETDILAGINAACDTLHVLTGVNRSSPKGQASTSTLLDLV